MRAIGQSVRVMRWLFAAMAVYFGVAAIGAWSFHDYAGMAADTFFAGLALGALLNGN